MSAHVEWGDVGYSTDRLEILAPGEYEDSYGTSNEKHVLVIDQGGDVILMEGTPSELMRFGARILALASAL